MAVLIPSDIIDSKQALTGEVLVGKALQAGLSDDTWVWYNPPTTSHRPRFVMLTPHLGVVGIDVCDWSPASVREVNRSGVRLSDGRLCNPVNELGRRLEELRARLAGLKPEPQLQGLVALPRFTDVDAKATGLDRAFPPDLILTRDRLSKDGIDNLLLASATSLDNEAMGGVRDRLYPDTSFQRFRLVCNEGRAERIAVRVRLSAEQENLARTMNVGTTLLKGVAGSGKSLVLAARARYLAQSHPDWMIQVLCFNYALVPYLTKLIGTNYGHVQVDTFYRWVRTLHLWLDWRNPGDHKAAIDEAIATRRFANCNDAILIDEGQDFVPDWYRLIHHTLRPHRGGALIALDGAQSIYQELSLAQVSDGNMSAVCLDKNYRNTAQIGHFSFGSVFGVRPSPGGQVGDSRRPSLGEFVSEGEPVQVVWAQVWDEQAEFVAKEIRRLVDNGHANFRDVAVLFPRWAGTANRLSEAMQKERIPFFVLKRNQESREAFDLDENVVKLLTVHAAKGLEFPVVFLFGAEAIPVPETFQGASEAEANWARVLYVGMTRATDLLYVTYTRSNRLVDRAAKLKDWCELRSYPDDFDF